MCACGGWLCNRVDSSKNVFFLLKTSFNKCFDMSEMFVSSLWKGDFDKLFTAMCAFQEDID